MHAAPRRFLVAALAAAFGLTGFAGRASATTMTDTTWYWSEYGAAHTLYLNGITWRTGVDRMRQTHCWGLGHWIVDSSGGRHFSHFYCTATPASGSQYDVVMNVTGQGTYAVSFASYVKPQTWYWPAQYTANALYNNGITWPGTTDSVTYDACSPFGASLQGRGVYYQHFYCSIRSGNRDPYTVIVNVTDKLAYTVKWVAFDDQLPATPAAPRASRRQRPRPLRVAQSRQPPRPRPRRRHPIRTATCTATCSATSARRRRRRILRRGRSTRRCWPERR